MRTLTSLLATLALLFLCTIPALGAVVPDDYPTIQAALDAGETQIYVDDGDYHEVLSITHSVELLPKPPEWNGQPTPFPRVDGLNVQFPFQGVEQPRVLVRSFHFAGPVTHTNTCGRTSETIFEACRFDAGLATVGSCSVGQALKLHGCLIIGDLNVPIWYPDITACTIVGGGITVHANGGGVVRDNLVLGPADYGITRVAGDAVVTVTGNTIRNVVNGILAISSRGGEIKDNVVEDCSGTGYVGNSPSYLVGPTFSNDLARRCAGNGFELLDGAGVITQCIVDSVGGDGITVGDEVSDRDSHATVRGNSVSDVGGRGIWFRATGPVNNNRVLRSGGDGIVSVAFEYRSHIVIAAVDSNVVGHSNGNGIVAWSAARNTSYANSGVGFALSGSDADSITHNIAYGNGGPGLMWTGTGQPAMGCNDWFGNSGGETSGIAPALDDLSVDPLFCDLANDDVGLSAGSPLLNAPGCGLIGALGLACSAPVGVPPSEQPEVGGLQVHPLPTRGGVEFSWPPEPGQVRVEIFDLQGARRWSRTADGNMGKLHWGGVDRDGVALPSGVYFIRLVGKTESEARLVLTR